MDSFTALDGTAIKLESDLEQLKIEHVLQRDRDVWLIMPQWPYLAIDLDCVQARTASLTDFPVFSNGQLWQNLRREDLTARLLGGLIGGGTDAGLGKGSRAAVAGKANAKANFLLNWNPPLTVGGTPWCAGGTHFIYVNGSDLFQHEFGSLITVNNRSRASSTHFNFTKLMNFRDRYNAEYLNVRNSEHVDLNALTILLNKTFEQNTLSLSAARAYHVEVSADTTSVDYKAPILTKYDRTTHDSDDNPKIEISFALLHYEKAIVEFNELKACHVAKKFDDAFAHGVYCTVAVAACIEAIANKLCYAQTGTHPTNRTRGTPLQKINAAASAIANKTGSTYFDLTVGQPAYDTLDYVRELRNGFMHAKELENDIDAQTLTSILHKAVDESECRKYLAALRSAVEYVFSQLPTQVPPIVTRSNVIWMGSLEVP
jgi:hypothetical protein